MSTLTQVMTSMEPGVDVGIPDTWTQGRTAYGGLTAALAVAAVLRSSDAPLPTLRAAQFAFTAPAVGKLGMEVARLRQGRTATSFSVTSRSGDDVAAQSNLIFAGARPSSVDHTFVERPDVPAPNDCPSFDELGGPRPAFTANFDLRPAGGALPFSQAGVPEFAAWVRHRGADGVDPAVALIALGDSLPPAAITVFTEPAPISSMTWSVNICSDTIPDPAGWFLLRSSSIAAADGYSCQKMEAWDEAGNLVMLGSQTVAIFC